MATPTKMLVRALRKTALRLCTGARYEWGHLGSCNCGHLAQTVTDCSKGEIHAAAIRRKGDWSVVSREYCGTSGEPIDAIIGNMLEIGLSIEDIEFLEKLSSPAVLAALPSLRRNLRHNVREDVVVYMRAWADVLERQLSSPRETDSGTTSPERRTEAA